MPVVGVLPATLVVAMLVVMLAVGWTMLLVATPVVSRWALSSHHTDTSRRHCRQRFRHCRRSVWAMCAHTAPPSTRRRKESAVRSRCARRRAVPHTSRAPLTRTRRRVSRRACTCRSSSMTRPCRGDRDAALLPITMRAICILCSTSPTRRAPSGARARGEAGCVCWRAPPRIARRHHPRRPRCHLRRPPRRRPPRRRRHRHPIRLAKLPAHPHSRLPRRHASHHPCRRCSRHPWTPCRLYSRQAADWMTQLWIIQTGDICGIALRMATRGGPRACGLCGKTSAGREAR